MPKRHLLQLLTVAALLAGTGAGCEQKSSTAATPATADSVAAAPVEEKAAPAANAEGPLVAGDHCYVAKTENERSECKLTLDAKGEVSGYIRKTTYDSASKQEFSENTSFRGPLKGDTAYVSVDTDRGGGRNKLEEKWVIKDGQVKTPNETLTRLSCQ